MACPGCGYGDNPADANFCENCGAEFQRAAPAAAAVTVESADSAPAGAVDTDPPAAASAPLPGDGQPQVASPTVSLGETQPLLGWTCFCGQENPVAEEYCEGCGEARPVASAALGPGSVLAGFRVIEQLDADSYRVAPEATAEPGAVAETALLHFGEAGAIGQLAATLDDLDPAALAAAAGSPLVPAILARGADAAHGSYLVLQQPAGEWAVFVEADGLSAAVAADLLTQALRIVQAAVAAKRLLVLSPAQALFDGKRLFLPQPVAPALPLSGALLADPAFLAPEIRAGERSPDGWAAGAFAVGALVQSAVGNALGFPREWHTLMTRLRDPDPTRRPASLDEVQAELARAGTRRFVSAHRSAYQTDIGHHHPVNQDAGGVWSWQRWDGTPVTLAVVADGVSAGKYSERASALTVELMHTAIEQHFRDREFTPDIADRLLLEAGVQAHQQVSAMPYDSYDEANATTLVAACLIGGMVTGIWCGDSRAYGVTPEGCTQLTQDHSWVSLMVQSGRMTREQARLDPRAHVIARWLGASDPPRANPGFDRFRRELAPGDRLLVCSDGLYMYFEPPAEGNPRRMAEIITCQGADTEGAVAELVQTALDRGGFDNITAALVAIQ